MAALLAAPATLDLLRAALDGTGPALLPSTDPRVLAALRPDEPFERDDVAVVVPTSGSTGEPKGALLTAANLLASATASAERLGGQGQWLLALPTTHIGGLQVLVRSLLAGTEPVLLQGPTTVPAFEEATARLTAPGRYVSLVPTQLLRLADSDALLAYDAILLGGAAPPAGLLERVRARGVRVVTTYGMSETSGGCVYDGVPLTGVQIDVGERIRLTGPVVGVGYQRRPDLTAQVFFGSTFTTNDLGRLDADGRLVVLGRADDVIVTGGEKVAPLAVESVLAAHPAVAEVAVVGVPDQEWGARVRAVVVLRPGMPLTLEQARAHVGASLPRAAAPRELVLLEALPLLASGKIDRMRLTR